MGTIVNFATKLIGATPSGYNDASGHRATGVKVAAGAVVDDADVVVASVYYEVTTTIPYDTSNTTSDDGSGIPLDVQHNLVNGYTDASPGQVVIGGLTEGDSVLVLLYANHGFTNPSTVDVTSGTSFSGSFTSQGTYADRTETGTVTVNAAGTITIDLASATGGALNLIRLDITAAPSGPASDSNPITLASSASEQTVQAMVATSVTTAGSVFDSNMIAVEDDMQVTAPLTVAPATYFTIADDGTYTHDADTTIVIPLKFYSPTTEQLSYAELTLEGIGGSRNMTAWIEANGAGGQVNEAWITYMKGAGASGTTFNELMFSWLGGLGYTGNLSDRVSAWAKVSLN